MWLKWNPADLPQKATLWKIVGSNPNQPHILEEVVGGYRNGERGRVELGGPYCDRF